MQAPRRRNAFDNVVVAKGPPRGELLLELDAHAVEIFAGDARLGLSRGGSGPADGQGASGGGRRGPAEAVVVVSSR